MADEVRGPGKRSWTEAQKTAAAKMMRKRWKDKKKAEAKIEKAMHAAGKPRAAKAAVNRVVVTVRGGGIEVTVGRTTYRIEVAG